MRSAVTLDQPEGYTVTAIVIHWLMVILIFILFGLGWYMVDLPKSSPERSWFFALHKSIGLTTALCAILRLAWRLLHRPPALPETLLLWKRRLANATHSLLYILMFLQPVSGYLSSSFSGYSTRFWGIPLPDWGWNDHALNGLFTDIHVASSILLLSLIAVHVIGALHHGFTRTEGVILRMIPGDAKLGIVPQAKK